MDANLPCLKLPTLVLVDSESSPSLIREPPHGLDCIQGSCTAAKLTIRIRAIKPKGTKHCRRVSMPARA